MIAFDKLLQLVSAIPVDIGGGSASAYRLHGTSIWSRRDPAQKLTMAVGIGPELNRRLGFRYEKEFDRYISFAQSCLLKLERDKSKPRLRLRQMMSPGLRRVKSYLKGQRLKIKTKWKELWFRPQVFDLIIVDDAYPHPQSAFRLEEYDVYLERIKNAVVFTTGKAFPFFRETRTISDVILSHEVDNENARGKIKIHDRANPVRARLAYTIFAGNAWENIEYFERNKLPFVFTLYPGGSFVMDDAASDERLRRIFGSEMFRRVIVTQNITRDYLTKHKFCSSEKIDFIYGVVTPRINLQCGAVPHSHFGFGKPTLDICFTAHKYTSDGHDKGYDLFLEVAKRLVKRLPECRFHVVGGFEPEDLPLDGLEGKISFYGGQTQEWLSKFYQDKDLILLCNVPFVIVKGAFDGFPTGCGSDAMLNKVALFCTDPLDMNVKFVDGRDLVIVPHDAEFVVEKLISYRNNPAALKELAENGSERARDVYSFESQMTPRIAILEQEMRKAPSFL